MTEVGTATVKIVPDVDHEAFQNLGDEIWHRPPQTVIMEPVTAADALADFYLQLQERGVPELLAGDLARIAAQSLPMLAPAPLGQ